MIELANALVAFVLGPILVPAALVTGNQEMLCEYLDGEYRPTETEICPKGQWVNAAELVKKD